MSWVAWRLQRTETVVAAGIVVLIAALLVPTGLHMASVYDHTGVGHCVNVNSFACSQIVGDFTGRFSRFSGLVGWFNLIPGIVGVLLAVPVLTEVESGTFRFAWTQSVTRRRWVLAKLGIAVGAALATMLVFSLLITWWRAPLDRLNGRLDSTVFDFEGTVDYAYVLFALGLALAVGVLWRRSVPALVVGFVAYVAARVPFDVWIRQRLVTPETVTWRTSSPGPNLTHAWVLSERASDRFGHPFTLTFADAERCARLHDKAACLAARGPAYVHAVYHPASRFWVFQGIETAIFGGVAVVLIAFAAWWIKERLA